ncbi:MAG TPA: 50S ribosomal protein L25/general stress protein Ctc [Prolixibacteraceae bacterium]|nr:50S ribosomal protein L25/general stress protein Ctc [Prolixibacteraceae bacterium]
MKSIEVKGNLREATGKKDAKKLRSQELVPCVLYGGEKPVHFYAGFSEFRKLVYTPEVFLVNLDIDGKNYQAIMQDTQWHPVDEQLMHVDFFEIDDKKPIKIDLPVNIVGSAKGTRAGGKLKVNLRKLKVRGVAKNIPDAIDVDVTELGLSQSIKVGDLKPEGIEFLDSKSNVIVTVAITRAARAAMSGKEGK